MQELIFDSDISEPPRRHTLLNLQLPAASRLTLAGCLGPEYNAILAHGRGFMSNKSTLLSAGGGVVRLEVQRELSDHWLLAAGLLLHATAVRPRIYYERATDSIEAFRTTAWLLEGAIGVRYAF
jgi:hypothetical protein